MMLFGVCLLLIYTLLQFAVYNSSQINPPYKKVMQGETVRFSYTSTERGIWEFNGGKLPDNAYTGYMPGSATNWLILDNVNIKNGGLYYFTGEEEFVVVEAKATLIVTSNMTLL